MIRSRHPGQALFAAAVAVLLGVGSLLTAPAPARAATPDLTIVTAATYDVLPDESRVAVSVAVKATNHLKDTVTKQYFFKSGYLAVVPGASGFKLSGGSGSPTVSVTSRQATYTLLKLNFGENLAAGATTNLTLTFDIKDPGGAPDRVVRISPSIVTFFVWAFATAETSGSSVTVRVPADYETSITRGPLNGPDTDASGNHVWTSGRIASPLDFIADVTAARPGAYVEGSRSTPVGDRVAVVVFRSWPDDEDWRLRMTDLFLAGLPVLGSEIGVPWPLDGPLTVQEAIIAGGGYAGLYDPAAHRIDVAYSALPGVILHEAAHAWFNGHLVADRWEAEAFASYYAEVTGKAMGVAIASPELTDALRAAAIPLNAWGAIGTESATTEGYAYAASLALARAIAERAGPDRLREVWKRAAAYIGAYQPVGGTQELLGQAADWRALLDLFEDVTGTSFEDLWRAWVTRPDDLPSLEARTAARAEYTEAVAEAGPWLLPRSIRDAMRAWQFDVAQQGIADARGVLRQRAALQREAAQAGLILPATLEAAFEGSGGLAAAAAEASAELATVGALESAESRRPAEPNVLQKVGLLGAPDPALRLADGRSALARGDLDGAMAAASEAQATWAGAEESGRGRLISVALLAISGLLLLGLLLQAVRRARRSLLRDRAVAPRSAAFAPRSRGQGIRLPRLRWPRRGLPYNRRPPGPDGGVEATSGSVGEGGDGDRSGGAR